MATPREQLANALQQARLDAGYGSQAALARRLNVSRSQVSKAETPTQRIPSDAVLIAWAGATGTGSDMLLDLAAKARHGTSQWFERWRDVEAQARELALWSPVLVPGLLQVPEYARALIGAEGYGRERVEALVSIRLERQAILERAEPPYVTAVVHESVLDRLIGSPEIMCGQLTRITELSGQPHIVVQVVPSSAGACAGLSGGFQIASCDGVPDVVNMTALEDATDNRVPLANRARVTFGLIRGDALSRAESRQLILEKIERWKNQ